MSQRNGEQGLETREIILYLIFDIRLFVGLISSLFFGDGLKDLRLLGEWNKCCEETGRVDISGRTTPAEDDFRWNLKRICFSLL